MLARSLLVGLGSASAYTMAPSRMAGSVHAQPRAAVAQLPTWNQRSSPAAHFRMQVQQDIKPEDIYDEFMGLDESGASVKLELDEKEKLYLECLDSYYNEGGKALLPDNKYEQLKVDLEFSSSRIMTYSKDEIRYLLANKRYKMGQPVLSDSEYDALRLSLKKVYILLPNPNPNPDPNPDPNPNLSPNPNANPNPSPNPNANPHQVRHFAGDVAYDVAQFIAKNSETMETMTAALLQAP